MFRFVFSAPTYLLESEKGLLQKSQNGLRFPPLTHLADENDTNVFTYFGQVFLGEPEFRKLLKINCTHSVSK